MRKTERECKQEANIEKLKIESAVQQTNIDFINNMLKRCTSWYHYPWAVLYFLAVLLFGWIWYIPKKIKRRL